MLQQLYRNNHILRRVLAFLLTLALVNAFLPGGLLRPAPVLADDVFHPITVSNGSNITLEVGKNYILTGTATSNNTRVTVPKDYKGTIRFSGLEISSNAPFVLLPGAYPHIVLDGVNSLASTTVGNAALRVPDGSGVHIHAIDSDNNASGTLNASGPTSGDYGAAAIGGNFNDPFGFIVIESGTINAQGAGANAGGAGIGGGSGDAPSLGNKYGKASAGQGVEVAGLEVNILINGGEINAKGGAASFRGGGAGIGGGNYGNAGTIVINGGTINAQGSYPQGCAAGIGGGGYGGFVDLVMINGGEITAKGGNGLYDYGAGAGIGGGNEGAAGKVLIQYGDKSGYVRATGGSSNGPASTKGAAGIGGGTGAKDVSSVTITSGTVTAVGGKSSAGIGGPAGGQCGDIVLTGGEITATGQGGAPGVGRTGSGSGGSVVHLAGVELDGSIAHDVVFYLGEKPTAVNGQQTAPLVAYTEDNAANIDILVDMRNVSENSKSFDEAMQLAGFDNAASVLIGTTPDNGPGYNHVTYQFAYINKNNTGYRFPFWSDTKQATTGGTYQPDEKSYNDMSATGTGGHVVLGNPAWKLSDLRYSCPAPADLDWGYLPREAEAVKYEIQFKNDGSEQLAGFAVDNLTTAFELRGADQVVEPGGSGTLELVLKQGAAPGSYAHYTGSKLVVSAKATVSGANNHVVTTSAELPVEADKQLVRKRNQSDDYPGGLVEATDPTDGSTTNRSTVDLAASLLPSAYQDEIISWSYEIYEDGNRINNVTGSVTGGALTDTATFPTAPADGTFILDWSMETQYVSGSKGSMSFTLDRTAPTLTPAVPNGVQTGPFDVVITASEPVNGLTEDNLTLAVGQDDGSACITGFAASDDRKTFTVSITPRRAEIAETYTLGIRGELVADDCENQVADDLSEDIVCKITYGLETSSTSESWALDYGYAAGDFAPASIELTNTGTQSLTLEIAFGGDNAAAFDATFPDTITLVSGEKKSLTVKPQLGQKVGRYEAKLTISSDDLVSSPIVIPVKLTVSQNDVNGPHNDIKVTASGSNEGKINATGTVELVVEVVAGGHSLAGRGAMYRITDDPASPATPTNDAEWAQWTAFDPGNPGAKTVTLSADDFPGQGGPWFIHWRVETDNLNTRSVNGFGRYDVDSIHPQVAWMRSSVSAAGPNPFEVTVEFSEPVTGLTKDATDIIATNAEVLSVSPAGSATATTWKLTVQAKSDLLEGSPLSFVITAGAVTDGFGNPNPQSDGKINGDEGLATSKGEPLVDIRIDDNMLTSVEVEHLQIVFTPNGKGGTDEENATLYLAGGGEVDASHASAILEIKRGDAVLVSGADYTATFADNTFTITPNAAAGFGTGIYTVLVKRETVKNYDGNLNLGAQKIFRVEVPKITGFEVETDAFNYLGGTTTVTVTGEHLGHASIALSATLSVGGSTGVLDCVITETSHEADKVRFALTLPRNTGSSIKEYEFSAELTNNESQAKQTYNQTLWATVRNDAVHDLTLSDDNLRWDLAYGYADVGAETIVLTNNGPQTLELTASFEGAAGDFATSVASPATLLPGEYIELTAKPVHGKAVGSYSGQFRIESADMAQAIVLPVTLTVTRSDVNGPHGDISVTADPDQGNINAIDEVELKVEVVAGGHSLTGRGATYRITNSATSPPTPTSDAEWAQWTAFSPGNAGATTVMLSADDFPGQGGPWFIHWRVETDNLNVRSTTGFGRYDVDSIRPEVVSMTSSVSAAGPNPFVVTVEFSEPVTGLDKQDIVATNAAVQSIDPASTATSSTWKLTVQADTSEPAGSPVNFAVTSDAVEDAFGNPNLPYEDGLQGNVVIAKQQPQITTDVGDNQVFTTGVEALHASITPNASGGSGAQNSTLYLADGTAVSDSNAQDIFVLRRSGESNPIACSVSYTRENGTYAFTVKPRSGQAFGTGVYTLSVPAGTVKNFDGNANAAHAVSFGVEIPKITGISVETDRFGYAGGTTTVTVRGEYLHHADIALDGKLNAGGGDGDTDSTITELSANSTQVVFTVAHPHNYENSAKTYTYTATLTNKATGTPEPFGPSVRVVVGSAAPAASGLVAADDRFDYGGGKTTLTLSGQNLHNYSDLELAMTLNGNTVRTIPLTAERGASTVRVEVELPENTTPHAREYIFVPQASSHSFSGIEAKVTVEAAVPGLGDGDGDGALSANPSQLSNLGGRVTLTVRGWNLHNFDPFEIHDDQGGVHRILPEHLSDGNRKATLVVELPGNATPEDLAYVFELYTGDDGVTASPTGEEAVVLVEGSKPKVTGSEPDQPRHSSEGGSSTITITGIYLENADELTLVDKLTGEVYEVLDIGLDGRSATITLSFPPNQGIRNDVHELEAYVNKQPTGIVTAVEVGDSIPSVEGAYATPVKLSYADTLNGNGRSVVTVQGNYLYNFDSIQLFDVVNQRFYDVTAREPQDDITAEHSVTVPSSRGTYTFEVHADGEYTGHDAHVHVDVDEGYVNPEPDGNEAPTDPDDKEWAARGVGHRGAGFTGGYQGFDFLYRHAMQEVRRNGENASITLRNVWFITQAQLDFAASGAREADWRNGKISLRFDTTLPGNENVLEGRLILNPFEITADVYPSVCTCTAETAQTRQLFAQRYGADRPAAVVRLAQEEPFGAQVEVLAKVDLGGLDTDRLVVYRHDRETGEFARVADARCTVDRNGFVNFFVGDGGDYVVSGEPAPAQEPDAVAPPTLPDAEIQRKDEEIPVE